MFNNQEQRLFTTNLIAYPYFGEEVQSERLSILILIFAVTLAFFIIAPGLLNKPFAPYQNLKFANIL